MSELPFIPFDGPPSTEPVDQFDHDFWPAYPRKVGKRTARAAFKKARGRAAIGPILEGLARYKANKPAYCDWMHPTTFLNGDHWEDEYDTAPQRAPLTPERLAIIAAHVNRAFCERGKYDRETLQACVDAGLITVEQMEEKL